VLGREPDSMSPLYLAGIRRQLAAGGMPVEQVSDEDLRKGMQMMAEGFRDAAPMTAAQAATVILDGVRANRWRILVGGDAEIIDADVRADPEHAYDIEFWEGLRAKGCFRGFG
jgi:hypothetical protein